MALNFVLKLIKDGKIVQNYSVIEEIVLGRAEDCGIRLNDRAVSRYHLIFKKVGDYLQIQKKSEFAPLKVNGQECVEAVLKEGDVVEVGTYQLIVNQEKSGSSSQNAEPSAPPRSPSGRTPQPEIPLKASPIASDDFRSSLAIDLNQENPQAEGEPPLASLASDGVESPASEAAVLESAPNDEPKAAADGASFVLEPPEVSQISYNENDPEGNGETKIASLGKFQAKLLFKEGTANYTEYHLSKDETSIGRGKSCDIILNDKKSSRKNAVIRRAGLTFTIIDLNSANGTFVNGVKVTEQALSGDDQILVGEVAFQFKVVSVDYLAREKNFMSLPLELEVPEFSEEFPKNSIASQNQGGVESGLANEDFAVNSSQNPMGNPSDPLSFESGKPQSSLAATRDFSRVTGIAGVSVGAGQKKTLLNKFKALPRRAQVIWICFALAFGWFTLTNDPVTVTPAVAPKKDLVSPNPMSSPVSKAPLSFDALLPEQQQFVKAQYELAFNYFKLKDYDRSIYEVNKIFDLVPDYLNSREIKRYAEEGKQRMQAIQEERQKKEDEIKLKEKIAELLEEARKNMEKKEYEQAKELFSKILAIDPDNVSVPPWRKIIEDYEAQVAINAQQNQVQTQINKQAQVYFAEGQALKKKKNFYPAIESFQKVMDIGCNDRKLISNSKNMIRQIHSLIAELRDPILKEAKELEDQGNFTKAFSLYKEATHIDSHHPAGFAGINRIKGILHDRAKILYTEAILAESYSDFEAAKNLFLECQKVAPADDLYHERAIRKLAHYFKKEESSSSGGPP